MKRTQENTNKMPQLTDDDIEVAEDSKKSGVTHELELEERD